MFETYQILIQTPSTFLFDPLEQFDVLAVVNLGKYAVTNLALILALNVVLMGNWILFLIIVNRQFVARSAICLSHRIYIRTLLPFLTNFRSRVIELDIIPSDVRLLIAVPTMILILAFVGAACYFGEAEVIALLDNLTSVACYITQEEHEARMKAHLAACEHIKATEHIRDQQRMIAELTEKFDAAYDRGTPSLSDVLRKVTIKKVVIFTVKSTAVPLLVVGALIFMGFY